MSSATEHTQESEGSDDSGRTIMPGTFADKLLVLVMGSISRTEGINYSILISFNPSSKMFKTLLMQSIQLERRNEALHKDVSYHSV